MNVVEMSFLKRQEHLQNRLVDKATDQAPFSFSMILDRDEPQITFSRTCYSAPSTRKFDSLAGAALEGLSEHEELGLIVDREHTGTGNTTENVGTSALEQRSHTFSCDDLATGIHRRFVLHGL